MIGIANGKLSNAYGSTLGLFRSVQPIELSNHLILIILLGHFYAHSDQTIFNLTKKTPLSNGPTLLESFEFFRKKIQIVTPINFKTFLISVERHRSLI